MAALAAFVLPLHAQVSKVNEFDVNAPRDRGAWVDVAATPSGDVLSFITKSNGEWQLYRVRDWLGNSPIQQKLVLPGYFSKADKKDLETLKAKVFVTSDGSYAICVGSAWWNKRVGGRSVGRSRSDDVITVVNLAAFTVVASTRTTPLGLLEFHGVTLDHHGNILVHSSGDNQRQGLFVQLSVPGLLPGPKCRYRMIRDSPTQSHPEVVTDSECREALKSLNLDQYLKEYADASSPPFAEIAKYCQNNGAKFCHTGSGQFTADGKFGIAASSEGHDNILGSWVTTSAECIVFSTAKRADVAEIKLDPNEGVEIVLATLEGRNYLMLIRDGTHFGVYELRD